MNKWWTNLQLVDDGIGAASLHLRAFWSIQYSFAAQVLRSGRDHVAPEFYSTTTDSVLEFAEFVWASDWMALVGCHMVSETRSYWVALQLAAEVGVGALQTNASIKNITGIFVNTPCTHLLADFGTDSAAPSLVYSSTVESSPMTWKSMWMPLCLANNMTTVHWKIS